jgi:hypothetical protein
MLLEKKSWKRRAGRRHAGIKRGSLCHCESCYWSSPTNSIAIHVLPHILRRASLNRCGEGSCVAESPRSQRKGQRKHDNADQRQLPPRHRAKRNDFGPRFSHNTPSRRIIHTACPEARLPPQSNRCDFLDRYEAIVAAPFYRCARKYGGCFIFYSQGYAET